MIVYLIEFFYNLKYVFYVYFEMVCVSHCVSAQ